MSEELSLQEDFPEVTEGHILLVDDDPSVLEYLSFLLTEYNYPVIACKDVDAALQQMRDNPVIMILSDIRMPASSGIDLLMKIHSTDPDIPVILMTAYADVDTAIDAINKGAFQFLTKPFKVDILLRAVEKAVRYSRLVEQEKSYKLMLENTVLQKTRELAETALTASKLSIEIIQRLSSVAEFRDTYTGAHISRIGLYSRRLAEAMDMHREFVESITVASALHDIGKIGIPDSILLKPGPLTFAEFEIMKEHTVIGSKILKGSSHPILHMANSVALNHHEKWKGGGYPRGLEGKHIPLEGRIVKLADEYDALRSKRSYKSAFTHEEAYEIITRGDDRSHPEHFAPDVLNAFIKVSPDFDEIYSVHQDA